MLTFLMTAKLHLTLRKTLVPQFAQMLSQLLYNQAELRPSVLRALKVVVESNVASDEEGLNSAIPLSKEKADENLAFLRTQSESWFAVLFNVFGSIGRDGQGMVGETIKAWASIYDEKVRSLVVSQNLVLIRWNRK